MGINWKTNREMGGIIGRSNSASMSSKCQPGGGPSTHAIISVQPWRGSTHQRVPFRPLRPFKNMGSEAVVWVDRTRGVGPPAGTRLGDPCWSRSSVASWRQKRRPAEKVRVGRQERFTRNRLCMPPVPSELGWVAKLASTTHALASPTGLKAESEGC